MAYQKRITYLIVLDSLIMCLGLIIAIILSGYDFEKINVEQFLLILIILMVSYFSGALFQKLYYKAWEYASIGELIAILKAVSFSIVITSFIYILFYHELNIRLLLLIWMILLLFIGGSRFVWRIYKESQSQRKENFKNTLIIGAGIAGTMVVRQLLHNNGETILKPIAFIDDDSFKQKLSILGIPVVGTSKDILDVVKKYKIEHIVIAIPSATNKQLTHIHQECAKSGIHTQTIPMLEDIMVGKVSINNFKDIEVEDLLGREPISLNMASISKYISNKTVLVTGAGGSIGSEICRQISKFHPKKLVLLGHGENSIYLIDMELKNKYKDSIETIPIIADVQDRTRIFEVMEHYKPNVVYHAAAHKHVPLMENNPCEAVKNNVFGTKNVAEAADQYNVETFVMISSDKAVKPPNIMGATKRTAEMIIQRLNVKSRTKFVAVRFGNVLGSRGSVIPLFKKQIKAGGPVTVTHPEMVRYFMTIPEASRLVIQAGALAKGGEIFVLDMGEPVKIVDLAKNMIELSGHTVEEIGIKFTGVRPGEKLYEELFNNEETNSKQVFPKIFVGNIDVNHSEELDYFLKNFSEMSVAEVKEYILSIANNRRLKLKKKLLQKF
ncbi:polysaccharide biosynthesis protein [Bacillus massiliigorillae]|uniref:polysaccharide biosynthesis protein n=1 Tax=Bacillus massiliigorillae TaxID=1243664 RepID=UPI0003A7D9F6|nr:nucleoside-diphosphate sugar epimerase/dehydratase [Bacillus massiliigorillae]